MKQRTSLYISTMTRLVLVLACALTAAAAPAVTDTDVTFAVERALFRDPFVPANDIDVTTAAGVVTLTGTVEDLLARDRAVRLAEAIRGVRSVVNRISVEPSSRTDSEIAKDVSAALLLDPATDSYEIDVAVRNGTVTLSGTVDARAEAQLAMSIAKGVRGVTAVVDSMNVTTSTARSDREIADEVRSRLLRDVWVDEAGLNVSVENGTVTLTGTVGSAAEKRRAQTDSWVRGVRAVDADRLAVRAWADDATRRNAPPRDLTDAEILAAVRDAMLFDPRVNSFKPSVSVTRGIVTLSGVVDNLRAKIAAAEDANNTVGVRGVRNYLKVRPSPSVPDEKVVANIETALRFNTITESYEIDVKADDGVVTLEGTVDSAFERAAAIDVAMRTNGVVAVRNELELRSPSVALFDVDRDPWWDYVALGGGDSNRRPSVTTAAALEDEIEYELFWDPYVDSYAIDVEVDGGVATLTGKVDSWLDVAAATRNAIEAGATRVVNALEVE